MEQERSLFRTISWALLLVFFGLMIAIGFLIYILVSRVGDQAEQQLMLPTAANLAAVLQPLVSPFPDQAALQQLTRTLYASNPKIELFFLDLEGKIIEHSRASTSGGIRRDVVPVGPIRELLEKGHSVTLPLYNIDPLRTDREVIFTAAPIIVAEKPGYLYITLSSSISRSVYLMSFENFGVAMVVAAFVGAGALATLLGLRLVSYLRNRISRLSIVVHRFGENDFSARIPIDAPDEIGSLATTINRMADKLDENIRQLRLQDSQRRELIADVSHDLRGPVASIKGYLELLQMMKPEMLIERLQSVLLTLTLSTSALERLLNELFELAKFEAKERSPEFISVELDALAAEVATSCAGLASAKHITISLEASDDGIFVHADIGMIERVLRNLIENAIFYSKDGGAVVVRIIDLDTRVQVQIQDQGVGIDTRDMERILQRFEQGSNAAASARKSSGLGLAIVQRILALHQSEIQVASTPGKGSTFVFALPRDLQQQSAIAAQG